MESHAAKEYPPSWGQHNPYRCRKCGGRMFEAKVDVSGTATAELTAPESLEEAADEKKYDPDTDFEVDTSNVDYDVSGRESWECAKCNSTDIVSVEEAEEAAERKAAAIERGDVYYVHPGQLDWVTGQPVGRLIERISAAAEAYA